MFRTISNSILLSTRKPRPVATGFIHLFISGFSDDCSSHVHKYLEICYWTSTWFHLLIWFFHQKRSFHIFLPLTIFYEFHKICIHLHFQKYSCNEWQLFQFLHFLSYSNTWFARSLCQNFLTRKANSKQGMLLLNTIQFQLLLTSHMK